MQLEALTKHTEHRAYIYIILFHLDTNRKFSGADASFNIMLTFLSRNVNQMVE